MYTNQSSSKRSRAGHGNNEKNWEIQTSVFAGWNDKMLFHCKETRAFRCASLEMSMKFSYTGLLNVVAEIWVAACRWKSRPDSYSFTFSSLYPVLRRVRQGTNFGGRRIPSVHLSEFGQRERKIVIFRSRPEPRYWTMQHLQRARM